MFRVGIDVLVWFCLMQMIEDARFWKFEAPGLTLKPT